MAENKNERPHNQLKQDQYRKGDWQPAAAAISGPYDGSRFPARRRSGTRMFLFRIFDDLLHQELPGGKGTWMDDQWPRMAKPRGTIMPFE
jgi:hypothetical protein